MSLAAVAGRRPEPRVPGREACRRAPQWITRRPSFAGAEVHQDDSPAGFAHDVLRLDVAMKRAPPCGPPPAPGTDPTPMRADWRAPNTPRLEQSLEGEAVERTPSTVRLVVDSHAVDTHDVRMPDAREQATFPDDAGRPRADARVENLQRDLSLEPRIPGAVHRSEAPLPIVDAAPAGPTPFDRLGLELRCGLSRVLSSPRVNGGHRRKRPQFLDELPHLGIRRRREFLGPVHGRARLDSVSRVSATGRRQRASFIFKASRITARRTGHARRV